MPNYVEHDLYIYCEEENADEILTVFHTFWMEMQQNEAKNKKRILEWNRTHNYWEDECPESHLLPTLNTTLIPPNDPEIDPHGFSTLHNHIQKWGSKWGLFDLECETPYELYTCQSGGSPTEPLYSALSSKFPQINFHICLFESSMVWSMSFRYIQGALLSKEKAKYWGRRGG